MDFLTEIIADKARRVSQAKLTVPEEVVYRSALERRRGSKPHAFLDAVNRQGRINIIAEVKRSSPSKGRMRIDFDPAAIGKAYEAAGAVAVSVITEEDRFEGSLEHLKEVRTSIQIPILRKDFVFDQYQLYSTAAIGADAVLLIAAALDAQKLSRLLIIARDELGIDALVEVHDETDLEKAKSVGANLIGVNNRDLKSFDVSLETSIRLAKMLPAEAVAISESGIRSGYEVRKLKELGYMAVLIGESFITASDPGDALKLLIAEASSDERACRSASA